MSDSMDELTVAEVRERLKAAGLHIEENRLDMVRVLLHTALTPVRDLDTRAFMTVEPAVTFEAGAGHGER
jgi:hypothetical protein